MFSISILSKQTLYNNITIYNLLSEFKNGEIPCQRVINNLVYDNGLMVINIKYYINSDTY